MSTRNTLNVTGTAPPHDPDIEAALLGAVLTDPNVLKEPQLSGLKSKSFFIGRHRLVWGAMMRLQKSGRAIDVLTVASDLKKRGKLAEIGGEAALTTLVTQAPTTIYAPDYARTVREYAVRRTTLEYASSMAKLAYSADGNLASDLDSVLARARTTVAGLHDGQALGPIAWADLKSKVSAIEWLWPGWVPKGLLTILSGEQEAGKSIMALVLSKTVTRGLSWPDGQRFEGDIGKVLWIDAEGLLAVNLERVDDLDIPDEQIVKPRIDADGLTDPDLLTDAGWASFVKALQTEAVRLCVIDSLGGVIEDESDPRAKSFSQRLAVLASETGVPILLIHHPRKPTGADRRGTITIDRIRGSGGITQFARSVIAIQQPDPAAQHLRAVESLKMSLMPKPKQFGFTLASGRDGDLRYVNLDRPPEEPKQSSATDEAGDFLMELLKEGAIEAVKVYETAKAMGVAEATLKRAKKALHISSFKKGDRWFWGLPTQSEEREAWIPEN